MLNAWNWFYNFCLTLENIAFVLGVGLLVLALAWGKNGAKKLSKAREALAFKLAGWAAAIYLGLLAFTLVIQLFNYLWRLLPAKP